MARRHLTQVHPIWTTRRQTAGAAAPVIEKYTGVLAAADVFTESTTFQVLQSIRLDLGYGSWVHP